MALDVLQRRSLSLDTVCGNANGIFERESIGTRFRISASHGFSG